MQIRLRPNVALRDPQVRDANGPWGPSRFSVRRPRLRERKCTFRLSSLLVPHAVLKASTGTSAIRRRDEADGDGAARDGAAIPY